MVDLGKHIRKNELRDKDYRERLVFTTRERVQGGFILFI